MFVQFCKSFSCLSIENFAQYSIETKYAPKFHFPSLQIKFLVCVPVFCCLHSYNFGEDGSEFRYDVCINNYSILGGAQLVEMFSNCIVVVPCSVKYKHLHNPELLLHFKVHIQFSIVH